MPLRRVVRYPDPRLSEVSTHVGKNREGIAELVRDMVDTMYASNGIGLAAVQIGELKRVFIVEPEVAGLAAEQPPMVFIDPEIIAASEEKETAEEGCLSLPKVSVPVERPIRITMRAQDLAGNTFEVQAEGLFARCMQHENDHLNGRLLTDYVGRLKRHAIRRKMERLDRNDTSQVEE